MLQVNQQMLKEIVDRPILVNRISYTILSESLYLPYSVKAYRYPSNIATPKVDYLHCVVSANMQEPLLTSDSNYFTCFKKSSLESNSIINKPERR